MRPGSCPTHVGRRDQRRFAALDGGPAAALGFGGRSEFSSKPAGDDGIKRKCLHRFRQTIAENGEKAPRNSGCRSEFRRD